MLHMLAFCAFLGVPQAAADKPFVNEPAARAEYDKVVHAMRAAKSLSWVADYRMETAKMKLGRCTYKIWMKKPNFARVEAYPANAATPSGVIVIDGETMWTYWPNGKQRFAWESSGAYKDEYDKYHQTFYMKQQVPHGHHSIAHQVMYLGSGMAMTILDPSTFHGYTDSLQPYIDGVRRIAREKVGDEECEGIEVSLMKHQRSWYLWLSKKDHLPRKLKQIVRVANEIVFYETWTEVTLDADIPPDKFAWSPPADWHEWRVPDIAEGLLKPGTQAPDFKLASMAGGKIGLSDYRGKIVLLNKWRTG